MITASDHTKAESHIVDGEFPFTTDDFRKIAAMIHADAGIALTESKATLVYSRLAKRLRSLGLASFRDYCALVAGEEGLDERQKMLAALTTNVTRFFREPHHFEHLGAKVLPPLLDAAKRGAKVRLWSAACSSGQEPYSMAMTVLGLMPDAAEHDVRILATDIDPNVVAFGREGVYSEDLVAGIAKDQLSRFFEPAINSRGQKAHAVKEPLRRLVAFRELNLIGDWPMKGRFDAIFCRNVVIYFEEATQARIWSRFLPLMNRDARLYIGHSERVTGPAAASLAGDGLTTYRRVGGE
jgi:chemotaxis protein methyltransferase CheR